MKTLSLQEIKAVSGGDGAEILGGMIVGTFLGAMMFGGSSSSHYQFLENKYVEKVVEKPLYDFFGNIVAYEGIVYGEYIPTYIKVS